MDIQQPELPQQVYLGHALRQKKQADSKPATSPTVPVQPRTGTLLGQLTSKQAVKRPRTNFVDSIMQATGKLRKASR